MKSALGIVLIFYVGVGTAAADDTPTFNRDVAPILYRRCTGCHHAGEPAPFALVTYANAFDRADMIDHSTENRSMPPWKPVAGWGEFRDDVALTAAELSTVARWARGGAPEGAPPAPPAPTYAAEWPLGPPDQTLSMSDWFQVPARADDIYQSFVVPVGALGRSQLVATDFHPGNGGVVREVSLCIDTTGKARALDAAYPGLGYRSIEGPGAPRTSLLASWTPGTVPHLLPAGAAVRIPAGADLVMQIHYHPSAKPEADRSSVGLYFAKAPVTKQLYALAIRQRSLVVPAGSKKTHTHLSWKTPVALELVGISPHLHLVARSVKVWARLPDKSEHKLLYIDDWDSNWQSDYLFKEPVPIPVGSTLEAETTFDNSTDNPHNPDHPAKDVKESEKSVSELGTIYFQYVTAQPDEHKQIEESLTHRR